jgi:hypothetical protein
MTTERLRARAAAFFLAPAESSSERPTANVPAETRAVALGSPRDTIPLAAALALTFRAAERTPTALVAAWGAQEPAAISPSGAQAAAAISSPRRRGGFAAPAAARLAARLGRRELPAAARGRLVWLPLPDEPSAAATALRSAAAVVEGPVVTALAGPRPAVLEPVVEEHDLVIVAAEPGTALAEAALAALADRSVSAIACRPLPRGPARALALAGLAAPRLDPPLHAARLSETRS